MVAGSADGYPCDCCLPTLRSRRRILEDDWKFTGTSPEIVNSIMTAMNTSNAFALKPADTLLQHVALPAVVLDRQARITFWNSQAADFFQFPEGGAIGSEWHTVVNTVTSKGCCALCLTRKALRQGSIAEPIETTFSVKGRHRKAIMVPMPVGPSADDPIRFLILNQDASPAQEPAQNAPISLHSRVRRLTNDHMIDELTPRERDILACIIDGYDARNIASHLGLSHATARNYVQRILAKLGVHNKAEAVSLALRYNLMAS